MLDWIWVKYLLRKGKRHILQERTLCYNMFANQSSIYFLIEKILRFVLISIYKCKTKIQKLASGAVQDAPTSFEHRMKQAIPVIYHC